MPTQNVNLTPELDRFVKAEVASGHYNNASEVHRAALAVLAKAQEVRQLKIQRLKIEIQKGLDDSAAGRVIMISGKSELRAIVRSAYDQAVAKLEASNAERAE
ncbi:MAG: type II toxin-antitoxin system ParD family antitoxin [Verrucomicrobium sp.]|nr:type II toxin-antitoxin system ParD family antitoxin [Verrucomicrobium sp.]